MRPIRVVAAALAVLALAGCSTASDAGANQAMDWRGGQTTVEQGALRGTVDGGVARFRGVPYAEPPVRFAPARPPESWSGVRDASKPGPPCAQVVTPDQPPRTAEDCLTLSVTTPRSGGAGKPVLVWLHGGGFDLGTGNDFDPRRMAEQGDVVVVTPNYRLGILGYLATSGMGRDGGSFGLGDQQQVLRWVRANAAAFGGDPENVTLFGESGGATATCYQLTSPGARGLFQRAILQSAVNCGAPAPPDAFGPTRGGDYTSVSYALPDVQRRGAALAVKLGCDQRESRAVLRCLRELPVDTLLAHNLEFATPATGGRVLPKVPTDVLAETRVPVLAGFNRDESRYFVGSAALQRQPITDADYPKLIRKNFGDRAEAVLREYPEQKYGGGALAWAAVYTDRTFACPQLRANDRIAEAAPVQAYEFADRSAPPAIPFLPGTPPPGAGHAAEMPYLFDVVNQPLDITGKKIPLTASQRALARRMIDAWTGFATDGRSGAPEWNAAAPAALQFGGTGGSIDPAARHNCGFWQQDLR